MHTLVNGLRATTIDVRDRGLQYGDGLFETIVVRAGVPQLWPRHLQRLRTGCQQLRLPMPDEDVLRRETEEVAHGEALAVVKIIVTRGTSERGYRIRPGQPGMRSVSGHPWPAHQARNAVDGITSRWCQMQCGRQPRLAGLKHLNRLEQVLARAEWEDDDAEGLMCDTEGEVIGGTMSNLFLVRGDVLLTPDLSQSGVAGVMRAEVLETARHQGLEPRTVPVSRSMVESADELFITNAVIGIWPIRALEGKQYAVGKTTQALQAALSGAR